MCVLCHSTKPVKVNLRLGAEASMGWTTASSVDKISHEHHPETPLVLGDLVKILRGFGHVEEDCEIIFSQFGTIIRVVLNVIKSLCSHIGLQYRLQTRPR